MTLTDRLLTIFQEVADMDDEFGIGQGIAMLLLLLENACSYSSIK